MTSEQPLELRKSRRLGDQINFTFTFLRENFKKLFKAIMVIAGPAVLVAAGLLGYALFGFDGFSSYGYSGGSGSTLSLVIGVIFAVAALVLILGVVNEYLVLYLERGGNDFEVEDVWNELKKDLGKIVATVIGLSLIASLGYIILFVVAAEGVVFFAFFGIIFLAAVTAYLVVPLSMIITVRVIETDATFSESIFRCFELVKGEWWMSFVILLTVYLISNFVVGALYLPFYFVIGIVSAVSGAEGVEDFGIVAAVMMVVVTAVSYFLSVLPVLSSALQYFNLVEKRDAIGLMSRIESIGLEREKEIDANPY